jgi:hypothetical protein
VTTQAFVSLRGRSRLAGLLLLLATIALYVSQRVVGAIRVDDSFTATAANMESHFTAFTWAAAGNLLGVALTVGAVTLLDDILRPVDGRLSRLAAWIAFVGCALQAFLNIFLYAAVEVGDGTPYSEAFYLRQYQALAHLLLSLYRDGYLVALVFFGLYGVLIGWITQRDRLLPDAVTSVVVAFAFWWVMWVIPALAGWNAIVAIAIGFLAQLTLSVALLVMGLNEPRWKIAAFLQPRMVA